MASETPSSFELLTPLGWGPDLEEAFAALADGEGRPGRVSRVDRGLCTVLLPEPVRASTSQRSVATGDWVVLGSAALPADQLVIRTVLPRRSSFTRQQAGAETASQVIAANVDRVLLLNGLDLTLSPARIERYLALAWQSGALPVLVLTKADCCNEEALGEALARARGVAIGVEVLAVSAVTGRGLDLLTQTHLAPGRTVALLGPSGVGKSSLVNALAGRELMPTGATRRDGKGRHTTTQGQLLSIPQLGVLLDTPGMRGLGLWDAAEGLSRTFDDVEELAASCRFSNCGHGNEPGCAVVRAIESGQLPAARLERWRKLERELRLAAARQGDQQIRQESQRHWKAINKELGRRQR